jgi:hypothetical protein
MESPTKPSVHRGGMSPRERWMLVAGLLLVLGPPMLFSSPWHRRTGLLMMGAVALVAMWPWLRTLRTGWSHGVWVVLGGMVAAHAASFVGALHEGAAVTGALVEALKGLAGVATVGLLAVFWLDPRRRPLAGKILLGAMLLLLLATLAGFFFSIEKHISLGGYPQYYDPLRVALIWPLRLLTLWRGQLIWEHTNIAGFFFGIGFVALAARLAQARAAARWMWLLAAACLVVVFLSGSRSAWLMVVCGTALLLFRLPWRSTARIGLLIAISVAVGFASLQGKARMTRLDEERVARSGHVAGLVTRGSAGRLDGYSALWDELDGRRWFGRGLAETNKPTAQLMHEHSIYMASLRGGGLLALGAHLLILAMAGFQALVLYRRGIRWPAAVLGAVLSGLLFDRVSVFKLTGHHEFIIHWTAVLTPFVLTRRVPAADDRVPEAAEFLK